MKILPVTVLLSYPLINNSYGAGTREVERAKICLFLDLENEMDM